jgi:ATP-GRASP peptide maturase of grasp-with-spasm system
MVYIFSNEIDLSTTQVCKWLNFYGQDWIRINTYKVLNDKLNISQKESLNYEKYSLWYRKLPFNLLKQQINWNTKKLPKQIKEKINLHFLKERSELLEVEYNLLIRNKNFLNDPITTKLNKSNQLLIAESVGLKIPASFIVKSRKELINLFNSYGNLAIKSLSPISILEYENLYYGPYTNILNQSDILKLPEFFEPIFIQKYIEKKYEIRSFFLDNSFYSMVIFSQNDKQTVTDFRRYNSNKPNRTIPFKLPRQIESQLKKFLKVSGINSGSFDLIVTPEDDFVFLELNPVGQFGMVSNPCNYYLEKKIANFLIQKKR